MRLNMLCLSVLLALTTLAAARPNGKLIDRASTATSASSTTSTSTSSTLVADSQCTNGPTSRDCWSNGYSIAADFDEKWPTTGATRKYSWTFTNSTVNPDGGGERVGFLINGKFPGPVRYCLHPNDPSIP
jgi:hypothetical protein